MGTAKNKVNSQSGFTIVELITTMVVGIIIISSAIMILTTSQGLGQRHRDLVIVNSFAEQKIEALRSIGFLGLSNGTTDITSEMSSELNAPRSASMIISTFAPGIKQVDLTITYNDRGASKTNSYTTFVGELGVGQY